MEVIFDVLSKSFDFKGRSRRKEYWMFIAISQAVFLILFWSDMQSGRFFQWDPIPYCLVYSALTFMPIVSLTIRRLHDTGRSGWAMFYMLIPAVGSIIYLVMMLSRGTVGANKYGPDPLEQ